MSYHWEGDLILQETEIKGKRYVIGSVNKQISTDIREWISFTDDIIMKQTLKALTEKNLLPTTKNPGDFDRRAMAIWKHVAQNIKYVHDAAKQKKSDFWLFPPEILTLGKGDCEDGSFLLASLLTASGISPFCVRVVLGEVFDEKGKSLGGHCWPIYKNELGDWCILESTLDKIPSRMPEADRLSAPNQFFQYVPSYCFNNHHLWAIFSEKNNSEKPIQFQHYLKSRAQKVNIKKTRLPSGGWLSHLTGDWEPGHKEITEEVLKSEKFSSYAIDVISDASQDPDFYDWNTAWLHAQTENNKEGETTQSNDQSAAQYIERMTQLHEKMLEQANINSRTGLFLLGYLIHAIQDLATHQGITNAQHAWMTKTYKSNKDPDHDPANQKNAREYTDKYLNSLKFRHSSIFDRLKTYNGRLLFWDRLLPGEKLNVLNKVFELQKPKDGWDINPEAVMEYKGLNAKYAKIKDRYPVNETRWNSNDVFHKVLTRLV